MSSQIYQINNAHVVGGGGICLKMLFLKWSSVDQGVRSLALTCAYFGELDNKVGSPSLGATI